MLSCYRHSACSTSATDRVDTICAASFQNIPRHNVFMITNGTLFRICRKLKTFGNVDEVVEEHVTSQLDSIVDDQL